MMYAVQSHIRIYVDVLCQSRVHALAVSFLT